MTRWNVSEPCTFDSFANLNIVVTGGAGFVGRHLIPELVTRGANEDKISIPRSHDIDFRNPKMVEDYLVGKDLVIHLAARVGGIGLNQQCPAELIYNNAMMGLNVVHAAHKAKVKKVVVAGTVCAYPKFTPTPFKESDLWNGYPEETNAPYGIAKKMILVALQSYRQQYGLRGVYLLPANLYGPHDNFDLNSSHVIPAMIRKFIEAKRNGISSVTLWGDGTPSREFLFVEDCARGFAEAALHYDGSEPVNLGTHEETNIKYLAETIRDIVEYKGEIVWDATRPNGQPKRQLDTTRATQAFHFKATTSLKAGLQKTIDWYTNALTTW